MSKELNHKVEIIDKFEVENILQLLERDMKYFNIFLELHSDITEKELLYWIEHEMLSEIYARIDDEVEEMRTVIFKTLDSPSIMDVIITSMDYDFYAIDIVKINPEETIFFLSNEIFIVDWFPKKDLEHLLHKKISNSEYKKIVNEWNKEGCFEYLTDVIYDWLTSEN